MIASYFIATHFWPSNTRGAARTEAEKVTAVRFEPEEGFFNLCQFEEGS